MSGPWGCLTSARRWTVPGAFATRHHSRLLMQDSRDAMMDLGKQLCRTVALALKLDEDYFHDKTRHPGCVFRSVHYPPQQGQIDVRQLGIGSHADYEALTLLKQQEGIEALQVLNRDGQWVSAPPIKDTLVLNFGDQMNRLTNGLFLSTVHRVINRTGVERYSLPLYVVPPAHRVAWRSLVPTTASSAWTTTVCWTSSRRASQTSVLRSLSPSSLANTSPSALLSSYIPALTTETKLTRAAERISRAMTSRRPMHRVSGG